MDVSRYPRLSLLPGLTPTEPIDGLCRRLREAASGGRLFVKRDDLGPVGLGGNKLRKLEFLLGQAREEKADTLITVGALQSNHARLTAAAAARHGFACELFLTCSVERDDSDYAGNGNRLLDDLFGAQVHELPGAADSLSAAEARAEELRTAGRKAYVFPSGGSNPIGCLGYAAYAEGILTQSAAMGVAFTRIVTANGSGSTHAGLAAGLAAAGRDPQLAASFALLASEDEARARPCSRLRV